MPCSWCRSLTSMWWDVRQVLNVLNSRTAWEVYVPIDAYHLGLDLASKRRIRHHRLRLDGRPAQRAPDHRDDGATYRHRDQGVVIPSSTMVRSSSQSVLAFYEWAGTADQPQPCTSTATAHECNCCLPAGAHLTTSLTAPIWTTPADCSFMPTSLSPLTRHPDPSMGLRYGA
jgi:hypothetical protein